MSSTQPTILVTGATGVVGRPLLDLLTVEDIEIRAITRDAKSAELPARVETVEGDPSIPDTIGPALRGVTALFLHPRAVGLAATELLALAREQGVRRVVVLSAMNVDGPLAEQPSRFIGDRNKEVEEAAVRSGLEWVSLRSGYFARNTLMWSGQIQAGDVVRGPHATASEAPIDERDVAEVAVRGLLTDQLLGQRPVLTGPESLTQEEMVAAIGTALGRPLRFKEVPPEAARQGMLRHGHTEEFITAVLARMAGAAGVPATTTDEVGSILGRPALRYAHWAGTNAALFAAPTGP